MIACNAGLQDPSYCLVMGIQILLGIMPIMMVLLTRYDHESKNCHNIIGVVKEDVTQLTKSLTLVTCALMPTSC